MQRAHARFRTVLLGSEADSRHQENRGARLTAPDLDAAVETQMPRPRNRTSISAYVPLGARNAATRRFLRSTESESIHGY
jgi:hypothetical protein